MNARIRLAVVSLLTFAGAARAQEPAVVTVPDSVTPAQVLVPERGLNALGYEVLEQRHDPRAAVALFTLNVELHPASGNTYDSLAEAQLAVGDRAAAIRNYERALELDPDNAGAVEKLKELRGE